MIRCRVKDRRWLGRDARRRYVVVTGVMLAVAAMSSRAPAQDAAALQYERIQNAIARGVAHVYQTPPPSTFEPAWKYTHWSYKFDQEFHHPTGNHALANWALLACGESYQNPQLYRRVNLVLASDTAYVYDRGMRAQMLAELPRLRWAPWVHRDGVFLTGALTDVGNFHSQHTEGLAGGAGDNAHGQYGVLGLAGLQRAGWNRISNKQWALIDSYWRAAQQKTEGGDPAGWAIYSLEPAHGLTGSIAYFTKVRAPMTAGAIAVLAVTERALRGPKMDVGKQNVSLELRKGLRWLNQNFVLNDPDEESDRYFYFFTVQSVGRYTGFRTFNGIDWFRDVTAALLAEQQPDGSWTGPKGKLLSTGFALLYLARANDPLGVAKLRWRSLEPGQDTSTKRINWHNRPHDMWNFVDYASELYEVSTTWQIADIDQPIYELIESPLLYMSTDEAFIMRDEDVAKLRRYIDAGGLLVTNPDEGEAAAQISFKKLAERLFGDDGLTLEDMAGDDPLRDLHARNVNTPMKMVHNGVRPLMVHFSGDIGRELQRLDTASKSFDALSNIYLYATGLQPQRPRLKRNYVVDQLAAPSRVLRAARIRHAGQYDPEPGAMQQLRTLMANEHDVDLQVSTAEPSELSDQRIGFLTTVGPLDMSGDEVAALRQWIGRGGTLWLDIAGGGQSAIDSVYALVDQLSDGGPRRTLGRRDAIIHGEPFDGGYDCTRVNYRLYALRVMGTVVRPQLEMVEVAGRPAIIFSTMDLTTALAGLDHWSIFGYSVRSARQLVQNGCLAVLEADGDENDAPRN